MKVIRSISEMRAALRATRPARIGLVPTMGALHAGHAALMTAARETCDLVVVTLFVNPAQFENPDDLRLYPRTEEADIEITAATGADVLFVPSPSEMYPDGFATWVMPAGAALGLEGDHRPDHFRGVATVCLKLFAITEPALVFLGQKDAQQVAVLRQMTRDLNLDLELRVVPTVRDSDGLALSSRNVRLSSEERARASAIPRALFAGVEAHRQGTDAVQAARAVLAGFDIDYIQQVNLLGQSTLLMAVRVGSVRLIDNAPLDEA